MESTLSCPICGKPLVSGAPHGLCPACLLKAGIPTGTAAPHGARTHFIPPSPADLARDFPQLEILELIGQGGMGAVYRARQPSLDRIVALKILSPRTAGDPGFTERFTREARALARLSHANIVGVHDFGQAGVFPYLVMEFVDGVNLRHLLTAGKIKAAEALAIVPPICEALQYAHDRGIVHRDIKPENILLGKNGEVKIADFGLAKLVGADAANLSLTGERDVMGTPYYMAPEQVERPLDVDHRADIYSLGVVFYQMLTGELPLGRFAPPSRKVTIDVRLDEIVLRALEKSPEQRYQQANALKTEIETIGASASSAGVSESRVVSEAEVRIRKVAKALLFVNGLNLVLLSLSLLGAVALSLAAPRVWAHPAKLVWSGETLAMLSALGIVASVAGYWGARRMRELSRYDWAVAASVTALFLPLAWPIGIPVGIWALWTLWRGDVQAAFAAHAKTSGAPPSYWSWRTPWATATVAFTVFVIPTAAYFLNFFSIDPGGVMSGTVHLLQGPLLAGPVESFSPAVRHRRDIGKYIIMRGWMVDLPTTMDLTATNFAAARNGALAGVTSREFIRPYSVRSGEANSEGTRLVTGGPGVQFHVVTSLRGTGYHYYINAFFGPTAPAGEGTKISGTVTANQPVFVDLGSFSPGRKQVAVFVFHPWSAFVPDNSNTRAASSTAPGTAVAPNAPPQVVAGPGVSTATFPPTEFDRMESDPQILQERIRTAERVLVLEQARFDSGLTTSRILLEAQREVARLKARLAGDRVAFAKHDYEVAQRQLKEILPRRAAGLLTDKDVLAAESEVRITEIRLRQEEARAKSGSPANSAPTNPARPVFPSEFDTMESDPQILREQLRVAEHDLELQRARFNSGLSTSMILLEAERTAARLKAKLADDRLGFAKQDLALAQKRLEAVAARRAAGLLTDKEVLAAETDFRIAEIRLRQEEARADGEPPAITGRSIPEMPDRR